VVKGSAAISGIYDLEPIRLCYPNADARLDAQTVLRSTPSCWCRSAPGR